MTARTVGWILVSAGIAFAAGWLTGVAGRSTALQERRAAEETMRLAEARADILEGQLSVLLANFGNATEHFADAREQVEALQRTWRELGLAERAGTLQIVLAHLQDAERLSNSLDQAARSAADAALQALDAVGPTSESSR